MYTKDVVSQHAASKLPVVTSEKNRRNKVTMKKNHHDPTCDVHDALSLYARVFCIFLSVEEEDSKQKTHHKQKTIGPIRT